MLWARTTLLWVLGLSAIGLTALLPAPVHAACEKTLELSCHLHGHRGCGPYALRFWTDRSDRGNCEQLILDLRPGSIVPKAQEVLCLVKGYDTKLRLIAENYVAVRGPGHNDVIALDGNWAKLDLAGNLKDPRGRATLRLEHRGPSDAVIVKCRTYGPT